MAPRNPELPEGTDHIITGAMETGTGSTAITAGGGGASGGFVSSAGGGDDTGGTLTEAGSGRLSGALREGVDSIKQQAGDRIRQYADDGKTRASDALDELAKVVEDAAASVEERLGSEYGGYARRASDAVSTFATSIREREVDELYEETREFVRRSPAVAIGIAAAVGFTLVRLIKAGLPEEDARSSTTSTVRKRSSGKARKRPGSGS